MNEEVQERGVPRGGWISICVVLMGIWLPMWHDDVVDS